MKNLQEKIVKNEFNLIDFREQIEQMESMGNINDIIKYIEII